MEWTPPFVKWFVGGTLNASVNCLDRHVAAGGGDKVAYHWEGEPGDTRTITYRDLLEEVCRLANGLRSLGCAQGRPREHLPGDGAGAADRHARVRDGSERRTRSCSAGSARIRSATGSTTPRRRCSITADGAWRRGQVVPLKANADEAVAGVSEHRARDHAPAVRERARVHAGQGRLVPRSRRRSSRRSAPPRRWTRRTSSTSCTRAAPPGSRRGSCTRPAAT